MNPIYRIRENLALDILSPKLVNAQLTSFEPNYLYIGKFQQIISNNNLDKNVSLICIGDTSQDELSQITNGDFLILNQTYNLYEVFNLIQSIFNRYNLWDASLNQAIFHSASLQELLDIGYEVLDNPIVLMDSTFACIAKSGDLPPNYIYSGWADIVTLGYYNIDRVDLTDRESLKLLNTSKNAFIHKESYWQYSDMMVNIFVNNKRVANLSLSDIVCPFTNGQLCLLNYLASFFSTAIHINKSFSYMVTDLEDTLIKFISGERISDNIVKLQLSKRDWRYNDLYFLMTFSPAVLDNGTNVFNEYGLKQIKKLFPSGIAVKVEDNIVVLMKLSDHNYPFEDEITKKLRCLLKELNCYCGVSSVCNDFFAIKDYYDQSLLTISFGRSNPSRSHIFQYSNFVFDHILDICCKNSNINMFCNHEIMALYEYDLKHATDYIRCLYTYLSCGKNYTEAAKKLFLHRNTFKYRLLKISDMISIDFDNDSAVFHTILSCLTVLKKQNSTVYFK